MITFFFLYTQDARKYYMIADKEDANKEEIGRANQKIVQLANMLGAIFAGQDVDADLMHQLSQSLEGIYE